MNALRTIRSASWAFSLLYVVSGGVFSPTRRRCVRPVLCRGRTWKKGKAVEPASAEPVTSLFRFFCRCGKLRCCCVSLRKNSFQEEDGCPFSRGVFCGRRAVLRVFFSGSTGVRLLPRLFVRPLFCIGRRIFHAFVPVCRKGCHRLKKRPRGRPFFCRETRFRTYTLCRCRSCGHGDAWYGLPPHRFRGW